VFADDREAAPRSIEGLLATYTPLPLPRVLENAVRLVGQSDKTRKEFYVLTEHSARRLLRTSYAPQSPLCGPFQQRAP
jgi:hypothetical protein